MTDRAKDERGAALAASLDEAARHGETTPPAIETITDTERATMAGMRLDADQLDWAGELLFGRNWKTEMAEVMGWRDAARVREMVRGKRPVPAGAALEIVLHLRSRAQECTELADEIVSIAREQSKAAE